MLELLQEAGLQMLRLNQAQQRAFRIGVRNHGSGFDFISISQNDASRHAILDPDAGYFA